MTRNPDATRYGRCEATAKSTGKQCGRAAIGPHGKCDIHGGKSVRGDDHPNTVHGLRSPYLTDEDRRLYDDVSQYEPHELILEEFHMTKTRLLRAARKTQGARGEDLARSILEDVPEGGVDEDLVEALADVLDISLSSLDNQIGRLVQLSKEYRKWTEGDQLTLEHEHTVDDEQFEQLIKETKDAL